ncbi:MAG: histidinol dehydrogenase, partial [Clostridia bacterium]|nr:histidinol dehydrogenase [Clostridia bacterium]
NSFLLNEKDGVIIGQKVMPIEKVGLYVPGGTAAYPSSCNFCGNAIHKN